MALRSDTECRDVLRYVIVVPVIVNLNDISVRTLDLGDIDDIAKIIAVGNLCIFYFVLRQRHGDAVRMQDASNDIPLDELAKIRAHYIHLMRVFSRRFTLHCNRKTCSPTAIFRHGIQQFATALVHCSAYHAGIRTDDGDDESMAYLHPAKVAKDVHSCMKGFWPGANFERIDVPDSEQAKIPMQFVDYRAFTIHTHLGDGPAVTLSQFCIPVRTPDM